MADRVGNSIETVIEMQKEFLTIASKQTLDWFEELKGAEPYAGSRLQDVARESLQNFTRAQSKFFTVLIRGTAAAESGDPNATVSSGEKVTLPQLASDAVNAFIEAQKNLLDVAAQQTNVNIDASSRLMQASEFSVLDW